MIFAYLTNNVYSEESNGIEILFEKDYQNITEITKDSSQIIKDNYDEIWKMANNLFSQTGDIADCRIFKQEYCSYIFYRFIFGTEKINNPFINYVFEERFPFVFDLGQLVFLEYNKKLYLLSKDYIIKVSGGDGTTRSSYEREYTNISFLQKYKTLNLITKDITNDLTIIYYDVEGDGGRTTEEKPQRNYIYVNTIENIIKEIKKQEKQTNNIIDLDFTHFKSTQEIEYTKDSNDTVQ